MLVLAVSIGVYVTTHYAELTNLKIPLPTQLRPVNSAPFLPLSQETPNVVISAPISENNKLVSISSVRQASDFYPYIEVVLTANVSGSEKVDVTGWKIKSNFGDFTIPRAQEVYSFGGLQSDIRLRAGDYLNLYSGFGPKGNFRLNKCMGYIEDRSSFIPAIPNNCPSISRSELTGFTGACQDYAASLQSCEIPSANPPVPITDTACHEYLRKLNYVGCVDRYQGDGDFASHEWRVWLGEAINIFDATHDKVQLIDKGGKVIDEYVY